jgi:hypothetical protein
MITNCKYNILNFRKIKQGGLLTKKGAVSDDSSLWNHDDYPPEELIDMLQSCIELN